MSFSLSDITGDVDHIQTSLDSIRDLMFEHLPEDASINDLFAGDNNLLSPLLQSVANDKTLLENIQDQNLNTGLIVHFCSSNKIIVYIKLGDQLANPIDSTATTSQSVPNVNNQFLEKLIHNSVLVEEQQHTIDQLEREKLDLEERVHLLEQQQQQQRK